MNQRLPKKLDLVSRAGNVRLEFWFDDELVVDILSPKSARLMARHLETLADDAEAWEPEEGSVHTPPRRAPEPAAKKTKKKGRGA